MLPAVALDWIFRLYSTEASLDPVGSCGEAVISQVRFRGIFGIILIIYVDNTIYVDSRLSDYICGQFTHGRSVCRTELLRAKKDALPGLGFSIIN